MANKILSKSPCLFHWPSSTIWNVAAKKFTRWDNPSIFRNTRGLLMSIITLPTRQ